MKPLLTRVSFYLQAQNKPGNGDDAASSGLRTDSQSGSGSADDVVVITEEAEQPQKGKKAGKQRSYVWNYF